MGEWLPEYPVVQEYVWSLSPDRGDPGGLSGNRKACANILRNWFEWLKSVGEEGEPHGGEFAGQGFEDLLSFQKRANIGFYGEDGPSVILLSLIKPYLEGRRDWRTGYKKKIYGTLRGFFDFHGATLPSFKRRMRLALRSEVMSVEPRLTPEIMQRIVAGSNTMYKAVFLLGGVAGMGKQEILLLSNQGVSRLRRALSKPVYDGEDGPIIKVTFPPRKNNSGEYFTVIGGDALQALKAWMVKREKLEQRFKQKYPGRRFPRSVFVSSQNTPLTGPALGMYWRRKLRREGIIGVELERQEGAAVRYGAHFHLVRNVFRSQFMLAPHAESLELHIAVADFMMGHDIDPLPYKRIQEVTPLIAEYRVSLPYLNIVSNPNPAKWVEKSELEGLRRTVKEQEKQIRELERSDEKVRKLETLLEDPEVYEGFMETLQKLKKRKQ